MSASACASDMAQICRAAVLAPAAASLRPLGVSPVRVVGQRHEDHSKGPFVKALVRIVVPNEL